MKKHRLDSNKWGTTDLKMWGAFFLINRMKKSARSSNVLHFTHISSYHKYHLPLWEPLSFAYIIDPQDMNDTNEECVFFLWLTCIIFSSFFFSSTRYQESRILLFFLIFCASHYFHVYWKMLRKPIQSYATIDCTEWIKFECELTQKLLWNRKNVNDIYFIFYLNYYWLTFG